MKNEYCLFAQMIVCVRTYVQKEKQIEEEEGKKIVDSCALYGVYACVVYCRRGCEHTIWCSSVMRIWQPNETKRKELSCVYVRTSTFTRPVQFSVRQIAPANSAQINKLTPFDTTTPCAQRPRPRVPAGDGF